MPATPQYDVAIVGASIAGCAAATFYGRAGRRVALLERHAGPEHYKRLCTHFIQPSATPTIRRLGLDREIEEAGGLRNAAEVWTRWGWIRDTLNDEAGRPEYGYNIRREKLDPMVRALVARTPGVDIFYGETVEALLRADGRLTGVVTRAKDGGRRELTARLVVGADGRHSRVAELAGVKTQVKPHNRFAYFAYYKDLEVASGTDSQMWILEPDCAYVFPNDDGQTVALVAPTKEKLPAFKQDIEGNFLRFFDRIPRAPKLREAQRITPMLGMLDVPNISREPVAPGLALVGDAALASDPVWGIGVGWAFQTAEWLADATAGALDDPQALDAALARYRKQHRAKLAGHHFLISDFATGRPLNPLEKLFMSASAKDPVTARHFFAYGGRSIGVTQFLAPAAIARAALVNLRARRQRGRRALSAAPA